MSHSYCIGGSASTILYQSQGQSMWFRNSAADTNRGWESMQRESGGQGSRQGSGQCMLTCCARLVCDFWSPAAAVAYS